MRRSTTLLTVQWLLLMLIGSTTGCATQGEYNKNLSTGKATQAWLAEQRNDVNRAEPEPYPAERAGQALKRYQSTLEGSSATGAAATSPASSARSGSGASSSTPGMGR